jgi:FkbM family methyltransferase
VARSHWAAGAANRLTPVHGFVADVGDGRSVDEAARETRSRLDQLHYSDWVSLDYVNLDAAGSADVPSHSLDDLFRGVADRRPWFIKMDIEGAEAVALKGARELLARRRPCMLISVHPPMLERFGSGREQVLDFIRTQGYAVELVCQDHEEHWWCDPL